MPKFNIGDRVRVVEIDGKSGGWLRSVCWKTGTVQDHNTIPDVLFDNGDTDCGDEEYLELAREETSAPSHIEINGKRYRLVEEA